MKEMPASVLVSSTKKFSKKIFLFETLMSFQARGAQVSVTH